MRQIKTKEQREKEQKKKQTILSLLLISLLAFSTAGYAFFSSSDQETKKVQYKGLNFVQQNNLWYTTINNNNQAFNLLPEQIEDIPINITKNIQDYTSKPLYIVNSQDAPIILLSNLQDHTQRIQQACIKPEECIQETPLKNCSIDNIIIFESNEDITQITQKENCVYLKGDITKSTNTFLYKIFNII